MKTTSLIRRLVAAVASAAITYTLFTAVISEADTPAAGPQLAQAASPVAVR